MTDISRKINGKNPYSPIVDNSNTRKNLTIKSTDTSNTSQNEINLNNQLSAIAMRAIVNSTEIKRKEMIAEAKAKAQEFSEKFFNSDYMYLDYDNFSVKQLELALEFMAHRVNGYYASPVLNSNDDSVIEKASSRFHELIEMGVEDSNLTDDFLLTDDEKYEYAKGMLVQYGTTVAPIARDLLRLNDKQYQAAIKIINQNPNEDMNLAVLLVYRLSDSLLQAKTEKFDEIRSSGRSYQASYSFANLYNPNNTEKYDRAINFNKNGYNVSDSVKLANLEDETERNEVIALSNDYGISISDAYDIYSNYKGHERKKAIEVKKLGYSMVQIVQFIIEMKTQARKNNPTADEEEINKLEQARIDDAVDVLNEFLNDKTKYCDRKTAMTFAKLEPQEFEIAKRYYDICKNVDVAAACAKDSDLTPEMHSKIEELLKNGFIYGANLSVKSGEADKYLQEAAEKNKVVEQILANDSDFSFDELTARDRHFIRRYAFESKFYKPEEYIHMFLQLKNLTTDKDNFHIFNTEHFQRKFSEEYSEIGSTMNDGLLYNNIVKALWIDPNSEEGKYFKKFVEMIKNGTVSPSAIRQLQTCYIDIANEEPRKVGTFEISSNMRKDIDLYSSVEAKSKPEDFQANLLNAYIPEFEDEEEAVKNRNIGDAFKLKNEDFIRIKTDDKLSEQMNITKETYAKLFPPVSRFSSVQQIMGDCYCIEPMMSLYCDDKSRSKLVKMFSEDKNGDVTLKLPNAKKSVTYKNGKLPQGQDPEVFSNGADGFKLLEHAYSKEKQEEITEDLKKELPPDRLEAFRKFEQEHKNDEDNIFIYKDNGEYYWSTFKDAIDRELYLTHGKFDNSHYDSFNQYLLGNGSSSAYTLKMLGYDSIMYSKKIANEDNPKENEKSIKEYFLSHSDMPVTNLYSYDKLYKDMHQDNFFDDNIVQVSMDSHAWSITKEPDSQGKTAYYLYNPHNQALPVKFGDIEELCEYLKQKTDAITIAKR